MEDRDRLLARVFVRLADTLVDDFDVVEFLHELCDGRGSALGAETAGVMLADTRGGLRLLASSEERMRVLEVFELQSQQGPCLDAFRTRQHRDGDHRRGRAALARLRPLCRASSVSATCARCRCSSAIPRSGR